MAGKAMLEFLNPKLADIPRLRELWKEAFSDEDSFLDRFFGSVFDTDHALVLKEDGKIVSALYIIDCEFKGKKLGYIYSVATDKASRGQGFATKLLEHSDEYMKKCGYSAAILRPASSELFGFYEKLGYDITLRKDRVETVAEGFCEIEKISTEEYAEIRVKLAPDGAVLQISAVLDLMDADLYRGEGFLLAAEERTGALYAEEFLGNSEMVAAITAALGFERGYFNCVGNSLPFALLKNYSLTEIPDYFGLAIE
jgi:ribosomal protein S18 acetylase RimI-like enzyme